MIVKEEFRRVKKEAVVTCFKTLSVFASGGELLGIPFRKIDIRTEIRTRVSTNRKQVAYKSKDFTFQG
jgi:hypothetical protein